MGKEQIEKKKSMRKVKMLLGGSLGIEGKFQVVEDDPRVKILKGNELSQPKTTGFLTLWLTALKTAQRSLDSVDKYVEKYGHGEVHALIEKCIINNEESRLGEDFRYNSLTGEVVSPRCTSLQDIHHRLSQLKKIYNEF